MPKGIYGPTWALLSPSNLLDDSERPKLLGSIVKDFEYPLAAFIPEDVNKIIPAKFVSKPTEDINFKVALTKASGRSSHQRLADVLDASFQKNIKNETHLESTIVQTHRQKKQDMVFGILKRLFKKEILGMIDTAPTRNKGAVFMVVALKTCVDAQISSQVNRDEKASTGPNFPVREIAPATTCSPRATKTSIAAEESLKDGYGPEEAQVAKGARIFAIQYRLIKKDSSWLRIPMPKPSTLEMGEHFIPSRNRMFNPPEKGEESDAEEAESIDSEEDEDDNDDDPIRLGALQHNWALKGSDENGIVMAVL